MTRLVAEALAPARSASPPRAPPSTRRATAASRRRSAPARPSCSRWPRACGAPARACCRSTPTSARASSRRSMPRPSSPAGRSRCCWCRSMRSPSCGARRSTRCTPCARQGRAANAQVGSRPIGVILGFETTVHPFAAHPVWRELRDLSPAERRPRLAADADLRRRLVGAAHRRRRAGLHGRVVPQDVPDRRPARLRARCRQLDRRDRRSAPDARRRKWRSRPSWREGGKGLLMLPFENYAEGNLDVVHDMIAIPARCWAWPTAARMSA